MPSRAKIDCDSHQPGVGSVAMATIGELSTGNSISNRMIGLWPPISECQVEAWGGVTRDARL